MSPPRHEQIRFSDLRDRLSEARTLIEQLGIQWKGRFAIYEEIVQAQAMWAGRTIIRPPRSDAELRLFREAISQCQQLVASTKLWPSVRVALLRNKIRTILGGTSTQEIDDDPSRNALVEFTAAQVMADGGVHVALTDAEDICAAVPPLAPFAVECKRPLHRDSLEGNLKRIRKQLHERFGAGYQHGLFVIAIDRWVTPPESFPDERAVARAVSELMGKAGQMIQSKRVEVGLTGDRVPGFGILLAMPVVDDEHKTIHTIQRLTYWFPEPDPRARHIENLLASRSVGGL